MRYLLFLFVFISSITLAQNGINYQGAATDSDGAKLVDQNISLRTSVLLGGNEDLNVYSETHSITTDQFGLFNVVIGQGEVVSGVFDNIPWGAGAHLKVELDATGGTDYSLVSTTQMMSVPYALHAKNAGLDSAAVADMLGNMNIPTYTNGNVSFGDYEYVNLDWTNAGGPETETSTKQVEKDGFLYVQTNGSGTLHMYISDSTQSNEITLFQTTLHENVVVPIKKGFHFRFLRHGPGSQISALFFLPLENGTNSIANENTILDSNMVAEMISSALSAEGNSSIPTGTVQAFAGETIPEGWMLCDGSAISRIDFNDLFEVIGEKYGTGDGTFTMEWSDTNGDGNMQQDEFTNIPSTFNIPDLRGRVIIGPDNMGGNNAGVVQNLNDIGVTGGSETHTLSIEEMPTHSHSITTISGGQHTDAGSGSYTDYSTFSEQQTSTEGENQPHNIMQPYTSINYIIKL